MLAVKSGYNEDGFWPSFTERGKPAMLVHSRLLKTVLFLGVRRGEKFYPRATGFLVSYMEHGSTFCHLVTAEHVVSGLLSKNEDIYVRGNPLPGLPSKIYKLPSDNWYFHPKNDEEATDVAVMPFSPNVAGFDFEHIIINQPDAAVATVENLLRDQLMAGPGDEVAIIGLFRSHHGYDHNSPIVRIGNISAWRGDPVLTKYCGYIDAHLIEARSVAGLSGSPVFLQLSPVRAVEGNIQVLQGRQWYLFGLMHGHFDIKNLNEDVVADSDVGEAVGSVHTGIGVVVPVEKIVETIVQPELSEERRKAAMKHREENGAVADAALDLPPSSDANPNHLADFTRLVDVAARKRPQGGQT